MGDTLGLPNVYVGEEASLFGARAREPPEEYNIKQDCLYCFSCDQHHSSALQPLLCLSPRLCICFTSLHLSLNIFNTSRIFNRTPSVYTTIDMPSSSHQHSSSSHKGKSLHGSKDYKTTILWACCNCGGQASMGVEGTPSCPGCYHYRCDHCPTEKHKVPIRR
jgi:hypothetical protein